jgi:release factor glutamine methyltransferase
MRQSGSTLKVSKQEAGPIDFERVEGALRWARSQLEPSPTAALDAQLLLSDVMSVPRIWVLAHPEAPLSRNQQAHYRSLIERRAGGTPVAYLRGWVEWHGLRFEVTEDVLVPRPETEILLEGAVERAKQVEANAVVDVGTGSGNLAVGLALALPELTVEASDISAAALAVARRNAAHHTVSDRVSFLEGDLIEPMHTRPDLIVANLPYLSDDMMRSVSADVRAEPVSALLAGPTGLELMARLRSQLRMRGWRVPMLLEIDPRESRAARALFREDGVVDIVRDYAGHDRVVMVHPGPE